MSLSPVSVLILRPLLRQAGEVGVTSGGLAARLGVKSVKVSVALQNMVCTGEVVHNGLRTGRVYYLAECAPDEVLLPEPQAVAPQVSLPVAGPRASVRVPDDFEGPLMAEWRRLRAGPAAAGAGMGGAS